MSECVALVTGATGGIGMEIVGALAERDAVVALLDRAARLVTDMRLAEVRA